ncbi:hypothetical protein [Bacillus thuringiensis]
MVLDYIEQIKIRLEELSKKAMQGDLEAINKIKEIEGELNRMGL